MLSMAGETSPALRLDPMKWMARAVAVKQAAMSKPILTGVFTKSEIIPICQEVTHFVGW
jgi:hypothetical protein